MNMKYTITEEKRVFLGRTLYRIKALKDFGDVKKGDLGGFIECDSNLSHSDNCWIYDNAVVYENAQICGEAQIYENAQVFGKAVVSGNAQIFGDAQIYGNAEVSGHAVVRGKTRVGGNAEVFGKAVVRGNARVGENAEVCGEARVGGNAEVCGEAQIYGNARICGNAVVTQNRDYVEMKNTWSSGRHFTYTHSNKMWKVGCFYGSSEALIEKAYYDDELTGKCYEHAVQYVESLYKILETN